MQWFLTTPEGQEFEVDCSDWSASWYYEAGTPRAAECKLTVPRNTPALEKQWIKGVDDGQVKFLGYVSRRPSISGATKEIQGKGVESLLWERPCPHITYSAGIEEGSANATTLNHLFADKPPWVWPDSWATYEAAGLLNAANSLIPKGWCAVLSSASSGIFPGICTGPRYFSATGVIKLRYCGKKSRIGTSAIYHDCNKFPEHTSLTSLIASDAPGIYRDDVDLYIYIPQDVVLDIDSIGFGYFHGNFFAYNAFDTKVRRGTIDLATTQITAPLKIDPESMIGDIIANIATIYEQKVRFRYEQDGLCYMDVVENFDDEEIIDIYEEDCSEISFSADSDLHPDALIGLGYGDGLLKDIYSVFDTRPGKAWIAQTESFENAMQDANGGLVPFVDAKWSELVEKEIIEVTSDAYDHVVPGNNARLHLSDEPDTVYQIASITRYMTKPSTICLGKRSRDLIDRYEAQRNASSTFLFDDLIEVGSMSSSGVIGVGDWGASVVPFDTDKLYLPSLANFADYNPAALIEITISPRQNCFTPVDLSSQFWLCMAANKEDLDANRVAFSETTQYMIGDSIRIPMLVGDLQANNYFRVYCKLNGGWPAWDRSLAEIVQGINTDPEGAHDRDDYVRGVWGRHLNKDFYSLLVKLENDLYAYQILNATGVAWAVGNGDAVAKALYYSFISTSGRSKTIVLNEILNPSPAKDRDDYVKGVWGKTLDSGSYMLLIRMVDDADSYAYQMHTAGNLNSTKPWYFGTKAAAAAAFYAAVSDEDGTRTESDILADINALTFAVPSTYSYEVHGYEADTYPIAAIIELADADDGGLRLAYRVQTAESTYTSWQTDENNGEDICVALLETAATDNLRTRSDIRTDISDLVFDDSNANTWGADQIYAVGQTVLPVLAENYYYECTTAGTSGATEPTWSTTPGSSTVDNGVVWTCHVRGYSWQAYGYEIGATPSFTVIQVQNTPQVLAYKLKWVDDEEEDWAIDTSSGADIASKIMPATPYFDVSFNAKIVRRRTIT
mgnify:CR=1 FL=1